MTVNINGKPFDWDGNTLYEGEPLHNKKALLQSILILAVIGLLSYGLYPFVVWGLKGFFGALLSPFGVSL